MLRAVRALFSTASTPAADEAARSRLVAAKAERDQRVTALSAVRTHLERVEAVLHESAAANADLEAAEAAAASAAQAWAEGSAVGEPEGAAFDAAKEARTRAYRLRLKADGAKAALSKIEEAESTAKSAVEVAQEQVRIAAVGILVADAEQYFAILDEYMPRIAEAVLALRGLRAATSSKLSGFKSGDSARIADRLAASGFNAPALNAADDSVQQAASEWLRRVRELVKDKETL